MFKKFKYGKMEVKSQTLVLFSAIYFAFVLNLAFWRYLLEHVQINNFANLFFIISVAISVVSAFYIFFNLIIVPFAAKPLLSLLLLFSSIVNYMMFSLNVFVDKDMMRNVFETTPNEAWDLVTIPGVIWVLVLGILPVVFLISIKIKYLPFKKELFSRVKLIAIAIILLLIQVPFFYKSYAAFIRNHSEIGHLLNTSNYIDGTIKEIKIRFNSNHKFVRLDENPSLILNDERTKTVFILMIGETARDANFSLGGYKRNTNPLLAKEDVIYFKGVKSCGTSTAHSIPCMFSNLTRSGFSQTKARYMENVLDLIKRAGYDVIWQENDEGCKHVCDRVTIENMLERKNSPYCRTGYCLDEVFLEGLDKKLMNIKKDTVIIMHTMGSHGPAYYKRYPDRFKIFKPTCDTSDIQNCSRESVINTYDNTIVYTDYIISSVINTLKKFPNLESGFLYVSDHGESLGEKNLYLHGMPYAIAPEEQKTVPMILWMSDNMKVLDYINYSCLKSKAKANDYSHDVIFHSLLSILKVKTISYNPDLDIFRSCRTRRFPY
jgi:lipid A ethanolaminephosphotransferase